MNIFNRTTKQRILYELIRYREVPLYRLMHPGIGGTSADRRIRELRDMGCPISWYFKEVDGRKTHTTIYKLDRPVPFEIKKKVFN